jgi:hypothetical protein
VTARTGQDGTAGVRYWHGGMPGLRRGDVITPTLGADRGHLVDGCPTCEARRAGAPQDGDHCRPDRVYVTTDREYARIYAAGYPRGALYRVEPDGELEETTGINDPAPSWAATSARVLAVYDPVVTMTPAQIRRLMRRLGVAHPVLHSIQGGSR